MSLEDYIKNHEWVSLRPEDRGPISPAYLELKRLLDHDRRRAIWHTKLPPTKHRPFGMSVVKGKLAAILGRDGIWHDVTPTPADDQDKPDPRRC